MATLSRQRIARHVVDQLEAGHGDQVLKQLAAYIALESRVKETELIIRDIYTELERRSITLTHVTTAHALDQQLRDQVKQLVGSDTVEIVERVEPSVLGGVAITTPSRRLDATIRRRLINLREQKV